MRNRNSEFNIQRRRCPACGRWTVKKRTYVPFFDERCGPCIDRGFGVRTLDEAAQERTRSGGAA